MLGDEKDLAALFMCASRDCLSERARRQTERDYPEVTEDEGKEEPGSFQDRLFCLFKSRFHSVFI